ncbi:GDSL-type esterase/lipase family protein [Spirosoma utsteinense]|uniref:SGNH hydrolase-type esterase domain-containing protein n=1 Tax=Spirosoma utsteinense TaxID=2585773 RepID=A0ABR6W4X2_9BACT|nr:GDSL-type esterase/lipase family protein [Spirosoma utsteinense]MBC3784775.1 hypothetical protein [Spirosoma utsteinense]MBC3791188.1 hypothetical protein [Spirosoma utsteinense]
MNSAFDFLFNIDTDWLRVSALASRLPAVSPGNTYVFAAVLVLVLLPFLEKRARQRYPFARTGIQYGAMCLLALCLWPVACVQIEPVDKTTAGREAADPGCDTPGCVPATVKRASRTIPAPTPQGLPVPTFALQEGTVAFGSPIKLSVSSLPVGAVIEYSYDNGKTWIPGDQVPVLSTGPILSRTRINELTSGPSQAAFKPYYQRMMVIGNSIMDHAPLPEKGWFLSNGMAASAPDKDFVHLLTANLAAQYPKVAVRLVSAGNFERQFSRSEYSIDEFNEPLQQFRPDLIIIRMGENIDEGEVQSPRSFESQFRLLLDRFTTYLGQPVKIVCTTSVWKRPQADAVIRRVCLEKGITLADLGTMVGQDQYFAFREYKDASVGAHPNDAGMRRIADLIWAKLP